MTKHRLISLGNFHVKNLVSVSAQALYFTSRKILPIMQHRFVRVWHPVAVIGLGLTGKLHYNLRPFSSLCVVDSK